MADYFAVLNRTLSGFSDPKPALRDKLYERARSTIRKQLDMRRPALDAASIDAEMAQLEEAILRLEESFHTGEAAVVETPIAANPDMSAAAQVQPDPQPMVESQQAAPPAEPPLTDAPYNAAPSNNGKSLVDLVRPATPPTYADLPADQIRQDLSVSDNSSTEEQASSDRQIAEPEQSFETHEATAAATVAATDPVAARVPVFDPAAPDVTPEPAAPAPPPPPAELPSIDAGESLSIPAAPIAEERPVKPSKPAKPLKRAIVWPALPVKKIVSGLIVALIVLLLASFFALPALKPLRNSVIESVGLSGVLGSVLDLDNPARPTPVKTITITPPSNDSAPAPEPKSEDRLGEDGSEQAAPQAPAAGGISAPEASSPATNTLPALAPGQSNAILYEEGASANDNTLSPGVVVWTLGSESIAEGLPEEPVISGRMDIPARDLVLLLSIKRNVDEALPASHVIELVFATPDDFPGGSIANINRFVLKDSEQARGDNLVGVPARIDDGIFLIALNNLAEARARNISLLRNQSWIDIPLEYRTGRRALVTLEKGEAGQKVFTDAFAAWDGLSG